MKGGASAWANGFLGMLIFSASMPATRVAVSGFDPLFLTAARAAIPGALSLLVLGVLRSARPTRAELPRLVLVALGVGLGFPVFSALALTRITAAHSMIWTGLLPLATALFGAALAGERPSPRFWAFAALGAACVVGFAAVRATDGDVYGDALMACAVLSAGFAYAEGAKLSRRLQGWQVISWALVLSLPFSAPLALWLRPAAWPSQAPPWIALAYVALFAQWIGFVFWYRGLARGGIAAVGQLQLLQPFFGLMLAALVLHENVSPALFAVAGAVMICVAGARRAAVRPA